MLRSAQLLICLLLLRSGAGRPQVAQGGAPEADAAAAAADGRRLLLLEAVKAGILSSLGMEREPRPTRKASKEELRSMFQLYREKLREMRGNSSQALRETWQPNTSTVLFPSTVEPLKVHRRRDRAGSGRQLRWYRAVFHRNPSIPAGETPARALLKIPTSVQSQPIQQIKVKVNRRRPMNSGTWTHRDPPVHVNVSGTGDETLDVSPEVEEWLRTDAARALVVDLGLLVGGKRALEAKPTLSLELELGTQSRTGRTRLPRSNKEDECDERGWCCRKSVTVSFKDIGWMDWVVAPTEYTMHFCDGTCPHNYKPASMHTQVKSRLHQITKGGTPRPCCVPAAYEPMVLMHYDSRGRLKLTPFEDLIVTKCHCA